ncbi:hypothetical protein C8R47DRAFT_1195925 [Mycena vitilis]|nr:hypothetical protein C8R47DRAFT_1195925 [Mycena vitilis]
MLSTAPNTPFLWVISRLFLLVNFTALLHCLSITIGVLLTDQEMCLASDELRVLLFYFFWSLCIYISFTLKMRSCGHDYESLPGNIQVTTIATITPTASSTHSHKHPLYVTTTETETVDQVVLVASIETAVPSASMDAVPVSLRSNMSTSTSALTFVTVSTTSLITPTSTSGPPISSSGPAPPFASSVLSSSAVGFETVLGTDPYPSGMDSASATLSTSASALASVTASTSTPFVTPSPTSLSMSSISPPSVSVETIFSSTGAQSGMDRGFVTLRSTMSTSASALVLATTFNNTTTSLVASTRTSRPTASPMFSLSPSSVSSFVSGSSSATILGPKATFQAPGTVENSGSSKGSGTLLQAGSNSTNKPLRASSTNQSLSLGAIFGAVMAGLLVLTLVVLLLVLCARRRRSEHAARNADGRYNNGTAEAGPITPFPSNMQPNRVAGGRLPSWMLHNSNLAPLNGGPHSSLAVDQQYASVPPAVQSPCRPGRQRGDSLSGMDYF